MTGVKQIATIVGARPQFIKAAPLSIALQQRFDQIIIHTGQHYDPSMSEVFFVQLSIPKPNCYLDVGSGSHAVQTARILERVEAVLRDVRPDVAVVFGDTNTTLGAALAAAKLNIPIAHVEAGLRSFRKDMPEEINRVLTDHLATWLFAPSEVAVNNLRREGISAGVHQVGDIMLDALRLFERATGASEILERLEVVQGQYVLLTVHRHDNADDLNRIENIFRALKRIDRPIVFPCHPRTRKTMNELGLELVGDGIARVKGSPLVKVIPPVGYLEMLALEKYASLILTDSGGVQKEAYWLGVPCVTLRHETEWPETIQVGANILAGTNPDDILDAIRRFETEGVPNSVDRTIYGDGHTAEKICRVLGG